MIVDMEPLASFDLGIHFGAGVEGLTAYVFGLSRALPDERPGPGISRQDQDSSVPYFRVQG